MTHRSTRPERLGRASTAAAAPDRAPAPDGRIHGLGIWSLAFGYFLFYAPYSALTRATSQGLLPGLNGPASSLEMLPAIGLATAIVTTIVVTSLGWWRYCTFGTVGTWRLPRPPRRTVIGGLATAAIIYTTTLMFTFKGVSIVLALLIMRGGVLVLAPVLDLVFSRRVRWFAWIGLSLSLCAVTTSAVLVSHQLDWVLAATAGTYLLGYAVRLRSVNELAKSPDRETSRRYFVDEQVRGDGGARGAPWVLALTGDTSIALHMRQGLTRFLTTLNRLAGAGHWRLYAALYCCGTLHLPRLSREHVLRRARIAVRSLLAGVMASFALTAMVGAQPPRRARAHRRGADPPRHPGPCRRVHTGSKPLRAGGACQGRWCRRTRRRQPLERKGEWR